MNLVCLVQGPSRPGGQEAVSKSQEEAEMTPRSCPSGLKKIRRQSGGLRDLGSLLFLSSRFGSIHIYSCR